MPKTLRERYIEALKLRGETMNVGTQFQRTIRFSRKEGGFYYLGKSGSLRFGGSKVTSIPVSDKFKQMLLESLEAGMSSAGV